MPYAYLIVNDRSAWPIPERRLASWYLNQVFIWPGCEAVEKLSPEWTRTGKGNYTKGSEHGRGTNSG